MGHHIPDLKEGKVQGRFLMENRRDYIKHVFLDVMERKKLVFLRKIK